MNAVFIGRFQPFHRGHHRVVREHRDGYDRFMLAMGSAETSRTRDNPLTADERMEVIHACFPGLAVIPLADEGPTEADNRRWAEKLERETGADVVISQNDLVQRLVREYTEMNLVAQELYDPDRFSGTELRRRIRGDEPWQELVPDCAVDTVERYANIIAATGDA
ncbi:MAG: adenylyltransferase/cytidyltransferase family protein [Candidatus Nanohaloarchaea archaeon]|nr:adenylyltransferase/cytidyltransferase family protein [Candidatus Nanohaloarchaea archaeon]